MGTKAARPAITRFAAERTGSEGRDGVMVVGVTVGVPATVFGRINVRVGLKPVPETDAVCGLPTPESKADSVPLNVVSEVGWKVTRTVQPELGLSGPEQLLVCE